MSLAEWILALLLLETDQELHACCGWSSRRNIDQVQRQASHRVGPELFVTVLSCEHRLGDHQED